MVETDATRLEALMMGYWDRRRHVLLQELAELERLLRISPTTKQLREERR